MGGLEPVNSDKWGDQCVLHLVIHLIPAVLSAIFFFFGDRTNSLCTLVFKPLPISKALEGIEPLYVPVSRSVCCSLPHAGPSPLPGFVPAVAAGRRPGRQSSRGRQSIPVSDETTMLFLWDEEEDVQRITDRCAHEFEGLTACRSWFCDSQPFHWFK